MAPIHNPYARKKAAKSPPQATVGGGGGPSPSMNNDNSAASSLAAARPARESFSQTFEAIETSKHYGGEQQDSQTAQGLAAANAMNQNDREDRRLQDRTFHAMLQPHILYVSEKQRGNGVLNHIQNVPWQYSRMVPDYILNDKRCALFLSCKYHARFPQYITRRISELKSDFELRVLLVLVDVEDNADTLRILNRLSVVNNMTLILAWSEEEAARYLETYKAFDGKDASLIQRREQTDYVDQVAEFLTGCKGVNKTDSANLVGEFRSLRSLMVASMDQLALVPGMGEIKVKRLHDAFHKPFSTKAARKRRKEREEKEADAKPAAKVKDAPPDSADDGEKDLQETEANPIA